ncbi:MAG: hypothetical protein Q9166_003250 [cf. Caloplaca sp. 2 TL-2023]
MSTSTKIDFLEQADANETVQPGAVLHQISIDASPSSAAAAPQDEISDPPPTSKTPSPRWWVSFTVGVSRIANSKIDMTISRLTFIISIVALVVAVLSYGYGAASFHVAKSAYQLQQLEFCKSHSDDPVGQYMFVRSSAGSPQD